MKDYRTPKDVIADKGRCEYCPRCNDVKIVYEQRVKNFTSNTLEVHQRCSLCAWYVSSEFRKME